MEKEEFTFVAIEKNGSGTFTRTHEVGSSEDVKNAWQEFKEEAEALFGSFRYEIHPEELENIPSEVEKWFSDNNLEIDNTFSGIF